MNIVWFSITLIHILSIGCLGLFVLRLFYHMNRIQLAENHYTLLFGFVKLRHVISVYLVVVVFFTVVTVYLTHILLNA